MGGVVILVAFTLAFLKFSAVKNTDFYVLLVATLGFGLIGFLDDYIKIVFKRSLGLTARQKMLGQLFFSAVMCFLLIQNGHSTAISIPGTSFSFDWTGWFYYPFVVFMMLAITNAVNFTDGLDGLLSGVSAIAFGAFAIVAMQATSMPATVCAAAMIGAVLGFGIQCTSGQSVYGRHRFSGDWRCDWCGSHCNQNRASICHHWRYFCYRDPVCHHSSGIFQDSWQACIQNEPHSPSL